MMDMHKYYEMIGPKNKNAILNKKVNREILIFTLFFLTSFFMIVILIVTAIKEINEILINGNTEIIGKYIILGMAIFYIVFNLLMIAYIEREPLKSLKYDDRIFIWLIFLIVI
ncbi:hypothetical protein [Clostridium thermosuccinogenes]|uniref:hypothetical protein n=1 Tax=Clostridium thermosuccinogenes TaxID=84032 RepID=UPI000CCC21DE|nr:hypothetical protein [Pseudoclostridium thermosuccinogenes]PNT94065.1 hypothetical protein CDQ83_11460 [Pseudoclostridium thermosuccinogenes]